MHRILARLLLASAIFLPAACDSSDLHAPAAGASPLVVAEGEGATAHLEDNMTTPSPDASTTGAGLEGRNRLGAETSPYLLQHAHNPVHWRPWGEDAFAAARALDRPIFLSIGYSTCYWCHVMERESFENQAIAAILNAHFVCIKVDREERPDVDSIYMAAVQLLNQGQGGWPVSVWLEPRSLKPFLAGTYFPPEDSFGRPGFPSVLRQIADAWSSQREALLRQADDVASAVTRYLSAQSPPVELGPEHVDRAINVLMADYDATHGGFTGSPGKAPKFPVPENLDFLMRAAWDRGDARRAVLHTLDRMAMGGMYDQVGGGFHRYSVDEMWLVPHFEKMLYDNGLLASTYAEGFARTGDPFYAEILRETLDYVLREMADPGSGAFFSAQDAEVNAREGASYLWTEAQIRQVLTDAGMGDDVDFALTVYGVDRGPNFQDPHHREEPPGNVLFLIDRPAVIADRLNLAREEFDSKLRAINDVLLVERDRREQPSTDDKVLTGWNGLMIAGMADGGRVLDEPKYIDAARRAADFLLAIMCRDSGRLHRTFRAGETKIDGFFEDYAYAVRGLLDLHRATGESRFRDEADALAHAARERFRDDQTGGFFDTLASQSDLFVRTKSTYDGAIPSGNSVMLHNLLDLYALTGEGRHLDDAAAALQFLSNGVAQQPRGAVLAAAGLQRFLTEHPDRLTITEPIEPARELDPVVVSLDCDEVRLARGENTTAGIVLRIAEGYHLTTHEPGMEGLSPLEIRLVGIDGIEIDVAYPAGEPFDGPAGRMLVHHGALTVPARITRTGELRGRAHLVITHQACTDRACLVPKTTTIPLKIEPR